MPEAEVRMARDKENINTVWKQVIKMNRRIFMKIIILGLTLLTSVSSFAGDKCNGDIEAYWNVYAINFDGCNGYVGTSGNSKAFLKCMEKTFTLTNKSITTSTSEIMSKVSDALESGDACQVGATLYSLVSIKYK